MTETPTQDEFVVIVETYRDEVVSIVCNGGDYSLSAEYDAALNDLVAAFNAQVECIAELKAMLRRLEESMIPVLWADMDGMGAYHGYRIGCPICSADKGKGHDDDCALAALLSKEAHDDAPHPLAEQLATGHA